MANPETGSLFLPAQASTLAPEVDRLFTFILALDGIFFATAIGLTIFFVIKYRHRPGGPAAVPISHNHMLELAWAVIPLLLLLEMFAWGYRDALHAAVAPRDALEIQVKAKRWAWEFTYPGDVTVPELVVPLHKTVLLTLSAPDAIYGFYVPALRLKQDALPGRTTTAWFEATQIGDYYVLCPETCTKHPEMRAVIKVRSEADYSKWLEEQSGPPKGMPLAEYGKKVFNGSACVGCHTVSPDVPKLACPLLYKAFGRHEDLSDGSAVTIDDAYLRESIMVPTAKIVKGYAPVMPVIPLKPYQVDALIAYIKSLK